ncbi:MAG TPA: hypothetical protein VFP55_12880 [Solirubrobacteraceae bacterium]|nr:hypothetical protein [Solirubrobacteraceae bacterium]
MELQGLIRLRRAVRPPARFTAGLLVSLTILLGLPAAALAGSTTALSAPPGNPVLVQTPTTPVNPKPPKGFRHTASQVERIAASNPEVVQQRRRDPHLIPYEYTRSYPYWQVSFFTRPGHGPQKERIQVYVNDLSGRVTQVWTGYQVAWTMARGYPGAFGRHVNSLYVWLPMCAAFLLPFLPLRLGSRPRSGPGGRRRRRLYVERPTLWHLDLLMLLGFSISLAFFNHADLGMSVPLVYPFLLYLLVRMLLLAFRRGRPSRPLRTILRPGWLALAVIFLIGFRIALNITDSNVIDVGYAGVIGANKVLFGDKLYGHWPPDNPAGDTYGPVNYFSYTPFNVIFGWSGTWDSLPAAHGAAIAFDLLTMLGLFLLGRSIRGPTTGVVLAYLWAAYPFTLFVLESNSNDSLVALTVVLALLVLRWAPARGVMGAVAGLTKFAPLVLGPLLLRGLDPPPRRRQVISYMTAYGLTLLVLMAYVIATGNLSAFWHDTFVYQVGRPAPFSIWGLWGGPTLSLGLEQHVVEGAMVALAVAAMFVPRRRGTGQTAAMGAAVLIAFQLCLTYWFYLYIVWFFPLVIVALVASHPPAQPSSGPLTASARSPATAQVSV